MTVHNERITTTIEREWLAEIIAGTKKIECQLPSYCPRLTHWPFRFTSIFVMGWISHTDAR